MIIIYELVPQRQLSGYILNTYVPALNIMQLRIYPMHPFIL